jgi:hypothetical protein
VTKWGLVFALAGAALLGGCTDHHGDVTEGGEHRDAAVAGNADASDGTSHVDREGTAPAEGPACVASGVTAQIAVASVDKLDLLFVVDNSGSMAEEQASLRALFPQLISSFSTGTRPDGTAFPPVRDLHLGVVSSDMGLVGIQGIDGCEGLGDDAIMQNTPSPEVAGCQASYPRFLTFTAGVNDAMQTANDLACVASLGTAGCGFEQQLEAGLKALWPSLDVNPETGEVYDPNRILFLSDENGFGALGHGDTDNAGFLRNDPTQGMSAIAIVVVTDEEDCSSKDTSHFTPAQFLPAGDPLAMQDLNLRCFFNPQNLYPLERYTNGYKALRPGHENLVLFFAIAGVPPDLTAPEDYANLDWNDSNQRDSFYDQILADPRMQQVIDPATTQTQGAGNLMASCNTGRGKAFPPIRIVQVAKGFAENGGVYSICQEDLSPALDGIVERISRQLGAACLPRPLVRNADGLVADCDVLWELPPPGMAPLGSPTQCRQAGFEFLLPPDGDRERISDRGGRVCKVAQLAVRSSGGSEQQIVPTEADGLTFDEGWYYDDFSEGALTECIGETKQRIAFTSNAKPPTGVSVKLQCLNQLYPDDGAQQSSCSAGPRSGTSGRVGDPCLPDAVPEGGFSDSEAYLGTSDADCGGGVCLTYRLLGDPREDCVPSAGDPQSGGPGTLCAPPYDVEKRIYCSCRCDAPAGYAECACPDGFACVDVLDQGSDDIRGGYCVRNGTFTN